MCGGQLEMQVRSCSPNFENGGVGAAFGSIFIVQCVVFFQQNLFSQDREGEGTHKGLKRGR